MKCDVPGWFATGCSDIGRLRVGRHPSALAEALLPPERHRLTFDSANLARELRLTSAKERWLMTRPGREVNVARSGRERPAERFIVVFVEDDKAIVSVRGESLSDALEGALATLGRLGPHEDC